MSNLAFRMIWDGDAADMTSVTIGITRTDTDEEVVAAGTAMDNPETGIYSITFTDPAYGLTYDWTRNIVDPVGSTDTDSGTLIGPTSPVTMTAGDIFTEARILLADTTSPYRWSDAELLRYLNQGQTQLVAHRADLTIDPNDPLAVIVYQDFEDVTDTTTLPVIYKTALAHYVAWRGFSAEDADKFNADKSAANYAAFEKIVYGL